MAPGRHWGSDAAAESGQAALLFLGVLAALLAGTLILFGFGQALGTRGNHQRAADLAAVSAAQVIRDNYARVFQPPFLRAGVPNPRHLSTTAYLALARAAAHRGVRRNGVSKAHVDVAFPDAGFAPTRVTVSLHGSGNVRVAAGRRPDRIEVKARATAELIPADDLGLSGLADGGGYNGPLAYRQAKPMRPDVAPAFDRMAAAARREAGLYLSITSGYRSDAEQAVLWAAKPIPHLFSALYSRISGPRARSTYVATSCATGEGRRRRRRLRRGGSLTPRSCCWTRWDAGSGGGAHGEHGSRVPRPGRAGAQEHGGRHRDRQQGTRAVARPAPGARGPLPALARRRRLPAPRREPADRRRGLPLRRRREDPPTRPVTAV